MLTGYRVERQLSKAQVQQVRSIEELSDEDLLEEQARMLFGLCDGMGLNPDETSVTDLINAMMAAHEEREEERSRHMPPLGSRGVRAPDWRRQPKVEKPLTRGEAERLARKPPKLINGVAAPASGANGRR
jgi:hypothetical protein